jgi:diguanylate cyclase (GGDEF)-like protein
MELLLKYEGHYSPPAWERLGAQRVAPKVWHFRDIPGDGLGGLLAQLEEATEPPTLAATLAVPIYNPEANGVTFRHSSTFLLDAAVPFNVLLARLRYPWMLQDMDERIEVHLQPIVEIGNHGQVFAHEALCRLRSPDQLLLNGAEAFSLAHRLGRQDDLDLAAQHEALRRKARDLPLGVPVFLNVMPSTLLHEDWLEQLTGWMRELELDRRDLVIEVVESERVDAGALAARCDALRAQGLRIALDDMGAGFNSLATLAMVRADFIKIDRTLVHEAQGSRVRSVLLEAIVSMADRLGATVIAEGLERPEDLAFCQGLGIRLAQGYLFARPSAAAPVQAVALPETDDAWRVQRHDRFKITDVIDPGVSFEIGSPLETVRAHFRSAPALPWAVLTDDQRPVGMVQRGRVLSRAVRTLAAACQPLRRVLPHDTTLTALARSLYLDRGESDPWTVIGADGCFMGVVEPKVLVAHILSRQEHGASLHPLSQLPTGPSLRQAIEMRVGRNHGGLNLIYIDLDHFKSFNDRYGFIRGDAMIRTLAEILRHSFVGRPDRLLGHIGGDDFILLLDREEPPVREQLLRVMAQFHALARHLYDPPDVERGYFTTEDGSHHPIASISVAWVNGSTGALQDSVAAAERAAYLKKLGKAQWGSVLVVEAESPDVHRQTETLAPQDGWERHALQMLEHLLAQPRGRDPHAMDHVFKAYPFFEMLFELDAEGRQRYPNWINPAMYGRIRAGGAGTDRAKQPYFAQVRALGHPYVSAIYLSSASEDFCLTISVPIRGEGETFEGTLVGDLNLAAMASLLDRREES